MIRAYGMCPGMACLLSVGIGSVSQGHAWWFWCVGHPDEFPASTAGCSPVFWAILNARCWGSHCLAAYLKRVVQETLPQQSHSRGPTQLREWVTAHSCRTVVPGTAAAAAAWQRSMSGAEEATLFLCLEPPMGQQLRSLQCKKLDEPPPRGQNMPVRH